MPAKKLIFILLILFSLIPLQAETAEKEWKCHLLTIGPGDPLYIWFGHTGLIVENTLTGRALFYDFGNFSFQEDHFYRNFAMGRLIYSSVGVSARSYLNYIVRENRDVTLQTLNLSQESIRKMAEYLNWKVQPGNNTYLYHHYLDNCSTRIRDLIDEAVGGQLKAATEGSAGTSFRRSFRRYSSHNWGGDWLLSFLQGRTIDRDITYWDTMFLPDELMRQVDLLEIDTPRGREPLVLKNEILVRAEGRNAVPDLPPSNTLQALFYGLIAGAVLLLLQQGALTGTGVNRHFCRILLTPNPDYPVRNRGPFLLYQPFHRPPGGLAESEYVCYPSLLSAAGLSCYAEEQQPPEKRDPAFLADTAGAPGSDVSYQSAPGIPSGKREDAYPLSGPAPPAGDPAAPAEQKIYWGRSILRSFKPGQRAAALSR